MENNKVSSLDARRAKNRLCQRNFRLRKAQELEGMQYETFMLRSVLSTIRSTTQDSTIRHLCNTALANERKEANLDIESSSKLSSLHL